MIRRTMLVALAALPLAAPAAVKTAPMEYDAGGQRMQGFFAYDDAVKGKRPGVLVIHEWWGHNEHARNQAIRFAEAGYAAFALDMYGKGKVAKHPEDAQAFRVEATKDPAVAKARFDAALALLRKQPQVDPERIAAAGYCFGGTVALEMLRAGADLDAVATFHAGLAPVGKPAGKGSLKGTRILVNTGAADAMIPPAQVAEFEKEMKEAGAKVEVVSHPGAKHGFTNPDAGSFGMDALAYDEAADKKSWEATRRVFGEVFGKGGT
jgi:dienelactone hydrolase